MVRDGLIQFVWYLTGPQITTVWELIGVALFSVENRRQTDAGIHTHLQLFLFYWAERCFVFAFIKQVRSPKLNPGTPGFFSYGTPTTCYLLLLQENDSQIHPPNAWNAVSVFSPSFLTCLQFASAFVSFEMETHWFTVKLAENGRHRHRTQCPAIKSKRWHDSLFTTWRFFE